MATFKLLLILTCRANWVTIDGIGNRTNVPGSQALSFIKNEQCQSRGALGLIVKVDNAANVHKLLGKTYIWIILAAALHHSMLLNVVRVTQNENHVFKLWLQLH